jgi:D-alanyl-D-alanine carboxypeptidase
MVNAMTAPRTLLTALLGTALLAAPAPVAAKPPDPRVSGALDQLVAAGAPGGIALADGRATAAGVADLATGRRLRPDDRIRVGSMTKPFVAVVALQLVGEGRLRLDDTVGARLPGVLPQADGVTLRQLLDHTSGIPDDLATPMSGVFGGNAARVWSPSEVIGLVRDKPLRFAPGSAWAYSNTGYTLVGMMIERATGRSLERELGRRIVRPLHLRNTSFPVRKVSIGARAASGYSLLPGPDGPVPGTLRDISRYSPSFAWASGNAVSTVGDVARFWRGLLGGKLLRPRQLRAALTTVPTGRPAWRQGLGIRVYDTPHGTLVGAEGDILGFSIRAMASPQGRRQAVVATNLKFGPPAVDDALDAAMDAAAAATFAEPGA